MSMAWLPSGAPLLSRRRGVVLRLPSCLNAKHANSCEMARNAVISIMARSAGLIWVRTDRQQAAERESGALSECQTFASRLQADLLLRHRSANAQTAGTWPERGGSIGRARDHLARREVPWLCRGRQAAVQNGPQLN